MATRRIRELGDDVLNKKCKEVPQMTPRNQMLIDDMLETMYEAEGVGLAAPQVGVLKQIVVIDIGDGPIILVNPKITESDGEQTGREGCLSVPGKYGIVKRPAHVKVKAYDRDMNEIEVEGEELLARALCHKLDHLQGKMYVDLALDGLHDNPSPEELAEEEDAKED